MFNKKMIALLFLLILFHPAELLFCQTPNFKTAVIPSEKIFVKSLDGIWRFKIEQAKGFDLAKGIIGKKVIPIDYPITFDPFYKTDYKEDKKWIDIKVPGNWEMANQSPATYNQPDNSSGFYRLWFEVPKSWEGRIVRIQFDGVQNGAEIWLNGKPISVNEPSWGRQNYHESGWTAFQVDLTPFVKFGHKNLLALRVTKNTLSSNLDSGDFFFLGGIYRTVKLFSVPKTNISDVTVQTFLLSDNKAKIEVITKVEGNNFSKVSMQLEGLTEKIQTKVENGEAVLTQIVDNPKLWSAEFPNLYSMYLELKDSEGRTIENVAKKIGVREVTIKDGVLLLNGVPIKFAGICRHDISATEGTAVGEELWRNDITMMKAANINAIRTSHYPYGSGFYDLCDELGMYVVDELPYCWCPTNDPSLKPAFEQRARETIRRDKNHACVLIWTIGNENKEGSNLQVIANLVNKMDTTRPSVVSCFDGDKYNTKLSDSHYYFPDKMIEAVEKSKETGRPHIYLENPNNWSVRLAADPGAWVQWEPVLERVWKVCLKYPTIPGTFSWEWQDRAIIDHNPVKYYTYYPKTGILLVKVKGLVDAFRNPRPWLNDVKMIYSPVQVSDTFSTTDNKFSFKVENHYSFTNLSYLKILWTLEKNKSSIKSGNTSVDIPPLKIGTVEIPVSSADLDKTDAIRVEFIHPNGNHIVAHRFVLRNNSKQSSMNLSLPSGLSIPKFNFITRKTERTLMWRKVKRFSSHLTNVLTVPAFAKTLTELKQLTANVVGDSDGKVLGKLQAQYKNGEFKYRFEYTGDKADVQEVGWIFQMPKNCDHFSWNREARWSIYPDHNIGRPEGTATPNSMNVSISKMDCKDAFDFNSTKYSCNWASLTTSGGEGLRVEFSHNQRYQCRAAAVKGGSGYLLFVNRWVCPPRDIATRVVKDFYLSLKPKDIIEGSFRVGTNMNF